MNDILSILLIDDNEYTVREINKEINNHNDIELCAYTNNAMTAIKLVHSLKPNVIILNLELLSGIGNGILFINSLHENPPTYKPFILVNANNPSQLIYSHIMKSGVDFIVNRQQTDYSPALQIQFILALKADILQQHLLSNKSNLTIPKDNYILNTSDNIPLKFFTHNDSHRQYLLLTQFVEDNLLTIGINPKVKGFSYLCDAILLYTSCTSRITFQIADRYKKNEPSVERAMQNAINNAWSTTSSSVLEKNYTANIRSDKGVPTLLEFISFYSGKLKNYYYTINT